MKLSFFGADQCVTGSCHCLDIGGKRILVDCGLQQGRDEVSNAEFPFAANTIDYLLVTHAHIDHSGRIPMLIKQGFQGKILTTRLTAELLDIMLLDSAHIQEQDAEWKNRKGERSGAPHVDPLYTIEDAQRVREFMTTCEYGQVIDLCEGVEVEFVDAGHLLGSACIAMDLTENGVKKRIVFSGDLGNIKQPIIRDPVHFHGADYVVMESTYGDRNHTEVWSYTDDLAQDHRRDHGPGRQCHHSLLCRGPYPGALVLHPGDQGRPDGQVQSGFPGVYRLAPCKTGHHYFHRQPPRLSGRRRLEAGEGRHPYVQLHQPADDGDQRGVQGAERGPHPQGHHFRFRHV